MEMIKTRKTREIHRYINNNINSWGNKANKGEGLCLVYVLFVVQKSLLKVSIPMSLRNPRELCMNIFFFVAHFANYDISSISSRFRA